MLDRFYALFEEHKNRGPDEDGERISLMFAEHPERGRADLLSRK